MIRLPSRSTQSRSSAASDVYKRQAYKDMAVEIFQEIREDFFKKYPLVCMHIYHSLGRVNAGEISLFVFVSAVHRKAAINACEEIVERIKKEVPIWGKEILGNENFQWKENS